MIKEELYITIGKAKYQLSNYYDEYCNMKKKKVLSSQDFKWLINMSETIRDQELKIQQLDQKLAS